MKRQLSTERQPWLRTAIYSFMTLTVTVIVSMLMLVVLGYNFNQKDGRLEQGGLLQFKSIPSGATVTLDQMRLGSLTTTKTTVTSGSHFVTFDRDGYRRWQKTINVTPGQVGWLNYARLIPQTITPQTLHAYTTLSGALASPSRNYMLLHEVANQPTFILVNIQSDTLRYDQLTLPADSYTKPVATAKHSFTLDSWSWDDQAVLIRHTYDKKTEWVLLDRDEPEKSVNINTAYGITPSRVEFAGKGNRLLFVQTDDMVRRINLSDQTLSRPLATGVHNFTGYDDKTIVYAATINGAEKRAVGYASVDNAQPVTIATYPASDKPLLAGMAHYFSQRYVAVVHGTTLTVLTGDLPTRDSEGSMKTLATHEVPAGATELTISTKNRFAVVTLPDGFATYDLELRKFDKTTWSSEPEKLQPLHWLDDYMLWSDYGGELWFYEFDGANRQNIMPVAEGFAASLSPNDKYLYAIAKTDDGYELRRALMILQ